MKKGFTLIELLGVLVILGVLAVITVPLVQSLITGAGEDSRTVQEKAFIKAAKTWAGNNAFRLPEAKDSDSDNIPFRQVSLIELICDGYLEANKKEGNKEDAKCDKSEVEYYYIKINGTNNEYNLKEAYVKISNEGTETKAKYKYQFCESTEDEDCTAS